MAQFNRYCQDLAASLDDRRVSMRQRLSLVFVLPDLLAALLLSGCKASTAAGGQSAGPSGGAPITSTSTVGGAGSAGCPTSNTTTFAKTKFVLHSGLAFGAFHRYIYKPLRAGQFRSGTHGRIGAFVKAGLAALFIKHEVRLAYEDAKANPTLCKVIAAPLQAVGDKISAAVTALKGGDTSGIGSLEQSVQDAKNKAASNGTAIQENPNAPLH
ncbi:MAG: hypothetical protein M3Y06_08360 [Actinomycetota bacterium]|nr:hypothetical protein [Actinomycetota bacterium]